MDYFYVPEISAKQPGDMIQLPEEEAHHVARVMRKQPGDALYLLDGEGGQFACAIAEISKKKCTVEVNDLERSPEPDIPVSIAIAPTKNSNRFEWFLEKATEIGVRHIYPLLCQRSERRHWKHDRWNKVLIAAMKQSGRKWLPQLHDGVNLGKADELKILLGNYTGKAYIAHCQDGERQPLQQVAAAVDGEKLVLIGPEGDFSQEEIDSVIAQGVSEISLGQSRLRTETAGIIACHTLILLQSQ